MAAEAQIVPGESLRFTDDQKERLGKFLVDMTTDLESQHKPFVRNIEVWWKWYEAQPFQETRNAPWPNASNIVFPLIQSHSDNLASRTENTIFATAPDVVMGTTKNEAFREAAQETAEFYNWAADDNEFDLYTPTIMGIKDLIVLGSCVWMQKWSRRVRQQFIPGEGGKPRPQSFTLSNGPVYERVPRERALWQLDRDIQDSEIFVRQAMKSAQDIFLMHQFKQIDGDEDLVNRILRNPSDGGYTADADKAKREKDGLTNIDSDDRYDIREAWVEWPLLRGKDIPKPGDDPDAPVLPLVVTFERNSGIILRVISKPFLTRGIPAYEGHFRTVGGRRSPGGVAKKLEHLQRGITTMLNQAIDAVTLSNSINFITNDPRLKNIRQNPGQPIFVDGPIEQVIRELSLNKIVMPEIQMIQVMLAAAERLVGSNDPMFGRETRMGGHPSPASSTAMLLRESQEMLRATLRGLRFQMARMAEDTVTLYQQFEVGQTGLIERAIGGEDAAQVKQWMVPRGPVSGAMNFELKAVSDTLNQEQELQKNLFVFQANASYLTQVLQLVDLAEKQQLGPNGTAIAMKGVEGLTASFSRILNAADVDDIRRFVLEIKNATEGQSPELIGGLNEFAQEQLRGLEADNGGRQLPPVQAGAGIVPAGGNGATLPGGSGF